ncbi:MAG: hypothetical protein KGL39_49585 [Patescibacteria group bacterium]|nr:hypothetical protein [Patescibacteria group bacterium]
MKLLPLVLLLLLSSCMRPQMQVCDTPRACVFNFNTCTTADACSAKPLELKGALP